MTASRSRIRALFVGAGAFVLVAVGVGGAVAASNPATLYACYDVYGNVRMGDTAQCKLPGGGRLVTWSTAGIPGPTGPAGATGSSGPTGPTGPSGVAAWAYVASDGAIIGASGVASVVHTGTGIYCIQLTGGADAHAAVASTVGTTYVASTLPNGCNPGTRVILRDLSTDPAPFVDGPFSIVFP